MEFMHTLDYKKFNGLSVLVTGGAGFIGSHLCDNLSSLGANIICIDDLSFGFKENLSKSGNFNFFQVDIRDKIKIREILARYQPEIVFHLAANASVPLSVKEPEFDFEINALGTLNLLEALRQVSPKSKIVFASSAAVYGEPGENAITEETSLNPISQYGLSKLVAEQQLQHYSKYYNLDITTARLFNTYGPRMPRFVVLDFIKKIQKDPSKLEILGNGRQTRDFTYVTDTVSGILHCAINGKCGEAYNIASGKETSVTQLAEKLIAILGLSGSTEISYTGDSWSGDAQFWRVDISKAIDLGYQPAIELQRGLKEVLMWTKLSPRQIAA